MARMAGTGAGYDLSVTTFSPDGRVFQVEYAAKAVENSGTALAICCTDGVVFAVEKLAVSRMLVEGTNKRIFPVHRNAGMAVAGLVADARQIVARARGECVQWKNVYGENMTPDILAERVGLFVHQYTLYWSVRPFGASVLMGHYDKETKTPSVFQIEPSGLVFKYRGSAIGKGRQGAKTEIEKLQDLPGAAMAVDGDKKKQHSVHPTLTCKEALFHVAKILHKVHNESDKDFELECSWICDASNFQHAPVPKELVTEAEKKAKDALEAEDDA